jgi:hypothetical protein
MDKFCYIDPTASWMSYTNSMVALESKYPGTKFVYWTMPITTKDSNVIRRAHYDQNLKNWIDGQKSKILFDLADIEAWSPDGQHQTIISRGNTYEKLYPGYTTDGGHLNEVGRRRAATSLYSLFGIISTAFSLQSGPR